MSVWKRLQWPNIVAIPLGLLCAGGVFAGLFVIVAMIWYWAQLDTSPKMQKPAWLLAFLCGWVGVPIYALLVYRRRAQEPVRN